MLQLFRQLIAIRQQLGREARLPDSPPGTVVLDRGAFRVAANFTERAVRLPPAGGVVLESAPGKGGEHGVLPPFGGRIERS
jgi:hypothetical protein